MFDLNSFQHAESLESRLNQYDELMESIRDSMDKMEGKTGNFETVNLNNKKLLNTLEKIVKQLDLSYTHQQALMEADFRWTIAFYWKRERGVKHDPLGTFLIN